MSRQRLRRQLNFTVLAVALAVSVVDGLTKAWARRALADHGLHVGGVVWLRLQYNAGVSFSFVRSSALVATVATLVVLGVVGLVAMNAHDGLPAVGFGLLFGGGLANVIDRLAGVPHRVTDFIAISSFPVFNFADVAITLGFIVLLVVVIRGEDLLAS